MSWFYQGGELPLLEVTTPAPELSWSPRYSDFPARARPALPIAVVATFFAIPLGTPPDQPPPQLAWDGEYPSEVRAADPRERWLSSTHFAIPLGTPPDGPIPALSWEPEYPDFVRGPQRSPDFPAYARPLGTPQDGPVPLLSWRGEQPAQAPGADQRSRWHPAVSDLADLTPPDGPIPLLSWAPEYPDFARSAPRAAEYRAFSASADMPTPPDGPIPLLSWAPEFPDFARGPDQSSRRAPALASLPLGTPPDGPVPLLSWRGEQPAAVTEPARVPASSNAAPIVQPAAAPPAPELSWAPEFPDFARAAPRTAHFQFSAMPVEPITAQLPELTWSPRYPDFARTSSRTAHFQFSAMPVESLPELSWSPEYPDFARGALRAAEFQALAESPRAALEPALLAWAPLYPSIVWDAPRAAEYSAQVLPPRQLEPETVVPLSWSPSYPAFARSRQPTAWLRGGVTWAPTPFSLSSSAGAAVLVTAVQTSAAAGSVGAGLQVDPAGAKVIVSD